MFAQIFLLQIIFVAQVLSFSLTEEQRQAWLNDVRKKCFPDCEHLISEESIIYLEDDYQSDNEEIRAYRCCMATCAGYMDKKEIQIDNILTDSQKYVLQLTIPEIQAAKIMMSVCKSEAEVHDNPNDVAGVFYNCVYDRMKSDF